MMAALRGEGAYQSWLGPSPWQKRLRSSQECRGIVAFPLVFPAGVRVQYLARARIRLCIVAHVEMNAATTYATGAGSRLECAFITIRAVAGLLRRREDAPVFPALL